MCDVLRSFGWSKVGFRIRIWLGPSRLLRRGEVVEAAA